MPDQARALSLAPELWLQMLLHVDALSAVALLRTCRWLYDLVHDDEHWRRRYEKDFPGGDGIARDARPQFSCLLVLEVHLRTARTSGAELAQNGLGVQPHYSFACQARPHQRARTRSVRVVLL